MAPVLEPLPSTGISKMLGVLEVLDDHGGREDLYRLSLDLHLPFSELLLAAKGAEMLELVETVKGELRLTALGRSVLTGPLKQRKGLLRQQMLKLKTFQHVVKLLQNVRASYASGKTNAACAQLAAFISNLQSQIRTGKADAELGEELLSAAHELQSALGC